MKMMKTKRVCTLAVAGSTCVLLARVATSGRRGWSCTPADTCSGHGSCTSGGGCACHDGFHGTTCSFFCTAADTCSGRGTCNAGGACLCEEATLGEHCVPRKGFVLAQTQIEGATELGLAAIEAELPAGEAAHCMLLGPCEPVCARYSIAGR